MTGKGKTIFEKNWCESKANYSALWKLYLK